MTVSSKRSFWIYAEVGNIALAAILIAVHSGRSASEQGAEEAVGKVDAAFGSAFPDAEAGRVTSPNGARDRDEKQGDGGAALAPPGWATIDYSSFQGAQMLITDAGELDVSVLDPNAIGHERLAALQGAVEAVAAMARGREASRATVVQREDGEVIEIAPDRDFEALARSMLSREMQGHFNPAEIDAYSDLLLSDGYFFRSRDGFWVCLTEEQDGSMWLESGSYSSSGASDGSRMNLGDDPEMYLLNTQRFAHLLR